VVAGLIVGCSGNPIDRNEYVNRAVYRFNKVADRIVVKPIARTYEALIPKPIQTMVGNFFQNLGEIPNMGNDILQGNFAGLSQDTARFLINSTWGVGGLLDVAAMGKPGLEARHQDFGLTLAKWGYKNSDYLVLPILGPSTFRDTIGRVGTYYMSAPAYLKSVSLRNGLLAVSFVDTRASLLKAEPLIEESVDEYVFIRDAYLQHRADQMKGEVSATAESAPLAGPPE